MPRATCRCGQVLSVPVNGPERVICPRCSAKVRVRRESPGESVGGDGDGFIRFACACGRRLKVRAGVPGAGPQEGQCPDCGRIVALPTSPSSGGDLKWKGLGPESPTDELDADDVAALDRWCEGHLGGPEPPEPPAVDPVDPSRAPTGVIPAAPQAAVKAEVGLRICPRCGRPVHLSAVACRNCGAPVPKR